MQLKRSSCLEVLSLEEQNVLFNDIEELSKVLKLVSFLSFS
jgi:hypothetical protein